MVVNIIDFKFLKDIENWIDSLTNQLIINPNDEFCKRRLREFKIAKKILKRKHRKMNEN